MAPEKFISWWDIAKAWVQLGEIDASLCVSSCRVSIWKPSARKSYTTHLRRFATTGGTSPWDQTQALAEKVLLPMWASGYQPGFLRGAGEGVSALKAVV